MQKTSEGGIVPASGKLQGKVAVVTGAGQGMGRAIARRFAAEGAAVALLSRSPAPLAEAVSLIESDGGKAIGIRCDVSELDTIKPAIDEAAVRFGTVDILVNNAHDTSQAAMTGGVEKLTIAQMEAQFRCGPIASTLAMQAALPYLKRRGGRVINLGSGVGVHGLARFTPYAMAKEANRALTRVAAREWAEFGITVNTICPVADTPGARATLESGVLDENLAPSPFGRMGDAETDVAPLFVFIASDDARYMTGYTFMADGGGSIDTGR